MMQWTHHHTLAICHHPGCDQSSESHTVDPRDARKVLRWAREHAKYQQHCVVVERGLITVYGNASPVRSSAQRDTRYLLTEEPA